MKFDTQYTEETCNTTVVELDRSTSPASCCDTTLGKINLWLLEQFWPICSVNWAVKSTSKLEDKIWPLKYFLLLHIIMIFYWCKRCCNSLVPLPSWRWHLQARQWAQAHHAYQTTELLQRETRKFIGLDLWTRNSPDLNPANYHIWSVMQDRVYQTPIQDAADLRQCWVGTWKSSLRVLVPSWRKRSLGISSRN